MLNASIWILIAAGAAMFPVSYTHLEAVLEYLDSKVVPAPKPKRTVKSAAPKTPNSEPKPTAVTVKEGN